MKRRNRSVEYMKNSVEVLGLFNCRDVRRLFDNAHHALIADRARAVRAGIDVGYVVADGAQAEIGLHVANSRRKRFSIFVTGAENVESKSLGALGTDTWELFQLIDQARHGFGKLGHRNFVIGKLCNREI